ncbi:MAG: mechanosensitive ion channel domain-containing protein [Planctomycetota bacterium]|nr:mechanosensitive ion channel domain-containing protein [Planctomycetota bacterium]
MSLTTNQSGAEQLDAPGHSHRLEQYSQYAPTLRAGALVIISAMFLPLMLFYLAWQLGPPFEKSTLQGALCSSLVFSIPLFFVCISIHKSLVPGGLAEKYLHWKPGLCRALSRTSQGMILLCLPLQVVYTSLEWFEGGQWNDSFGRFLFILNMAALSVCLYRAVCSLQREDWHHSAQHPSRIYLQRTLLGCIGLPLTLMIMAAMGFYFTAVQLSWRLFWSYAILMGIGLLTGFAGRLLLTTQFRIKLRKLEETRDPETVEEDRIDISGISTQVNRLLRITAIVATLVIGWHIWAGVLPAVNWLDQVALWNAARDFTVNGVTPQVTLRDLLIAIGSLGITIMLSRNLPGLLEIVLLDRLPLDRGGRYAISFVMRYLVGVFGILLAFRWVGFSWTSVQWLAAGLTVGLGFGLQEIFANLVSGIIILIERPIRVGDFVTVNGVTGNVTRMELRATTIRDLDHRESIIPNKRFITEDVTNWTLSDRLSRIVLPVGIAYGSDTRKAQETLYRVARDNPDVVVDPAPEVVFSGFGASTLDFELKVMIPNREIYFEVQHELNMAIDSAFRDANIEIAFPQQDVHLHGLEKLASIPSATQEGPPAAMSLPKGTMTRAAKPVNVSGHGEPRQASDVKPNRRAS